MNTGHENRSWNEKLARNNFFQLFLSYFLMAVVHTNYTQTDFNNHITQLNSIILQ